MAVNDTKLVAVADAENPAVVCGDVDESESSIDFTGRANWLRAAVLGANDGLVSTASLMLGVSAVKPEARAMVVSGFAGLLAGACSMAIGECHRCRPQSVSASGLPPKLRADAGANAFEMTEPGDTGPPRGCYRHRTILA
uniref:Vacuolar iron transporter n=1 Tax=Aegilops tauschii TaxID=37682 RepID=R7VZQ3_AEGTA